jgi:CHASE2 domain-containing sensor protein
LAVVAFVFAQRFYPIRYETGRIARLVFSGIAAALAALWIPAMPPLVGLVVRGATSVGVYLLLLWVTGFFRATEVAFAREMIARFSRRAPANGA